MMNDLPAGAPKHTRWMHRLTSALLLCAAAFALSPLLPAALRVLGTGSIPELPPSPESAGAIAPQRPERVPRHSELDTDEQSGTEDQPPPHAGQSQSAAGDDVVGTMTRVRVGIVPKGLRLFTEPRLTSAPVGEIPAGARVMIVVESGEWAYITQDGDGDDSAIAGWARRSEIAVR